MNLGDIDLSLLPQKPEIWLAKPDRTIIAKLNGRSAIGFSRFGKRNKFLKHTQLYKLNSVNEIEFSLPYEIEVNHQLTRNPVIDMIHDRYCLKVEFMGVEEWYIITDITNAMDGEKNLKILSCRSLGYELIDRFIRNYKVISTNLSTVLNGGTTINDNGDSVTFNGLLYGTLWTLDPSYDVTFDTMFRSIDISKASVLDALIQVAKTFNAVILWDTVNRKINFQQLTNIGQDKGFRITYENYMKSLENESKSDELATRFYPYGKDNLTINSVNPTGQAYIDDFSFFMYPFQRDVNKNVLSHSNYMSDSLCNTLLDYQALINANKTQFSNLLTALSEYQTQLTQYQNDLVSLNTTLTQLQNQLDIAQTTGQSTSSLLSQVSAQSALITSKQGQINGVNANIASTQNSISTLQQTLSTKNNFTAAQLQELIPYIKEKEWSDNNIYDAQSLYDQGLHQFQSYNVPQTVVKVDLVDIFELVTEQRNWDKVSLGDIVHIEYDTLGTNITAKIVEISIDHNEGNLALTIANVDDLLRDKEKVLKMLYQGVNAQSSLSVNSDRWNGIDSITKDVNALYTNGIDAAKLAINSAVNNSVQINNRGITISDSSDANKFIRMTNGVIGLSQDGGNTFSTAINATGVFAQRLVGQIIAGTNLQITNSSGTFSVDGNGVTISNMTLSLIRSDNNSKILLDATNGIKIQGKSGSSWVDKLYADTNGNLTVDGIIKAKDIQINGTSILNGNKISGTYIDSIQAGQIQVGTLTGFTINAAYINGGVITGGNISGTSITGGSIVGASIKTASTGARSELSSAYADVNLFDAYNKNIFRIEDQLSGFVSLYNPDGQGFSIGASGQQHYANGNWTFTGTVSGITAVFG